MTQDGAKAQNFFDCDKCLKKTWQRRADLMPAEPLPSNALLRITFPQMHFDRPLVVALGPEAYEHHQKTTPHSSLCLTWDEFQAVTKGCAEVSGPERSLRLVEALNYFAKEKGCPVFHFYGAANQKPI